MEKEDYDRLALRQEIIKDVMFASQEQLEAIKKILSPEKKRKPKWNTLIRSSGLLEHVCEHGVGHPDPKSAAKIAKRLNHKVDTWLCHGCDGCCERKDFPGRRKKK